MCSANPAGYNIKALQTGIHLGGAQADPLLLFYSCLCFVHCSRLHVIAVNVCFTLLFFFFFFALNLLLHAVLVPWTCLLFTFTFFFFLLKTIMKVKGLCWLLKYLASLLAKEQGGNFHLNKIWMSTEDS